jgi:hypothetical protein
MSPNTMQIEDFQFRVEAASFRYIKDSSSGAGWDFSFHASGANEVCQDMFPYDAMLGTEAAPLPLDYADDFTGVELTVPMPYDDESGEPFFGLMVMEEHEVSNLRLKFVDRDGNRYLIEIDADVAASVLGHVSKLKMLTWAEQLPDHTYPT